MRELSMQEVEQVDGGVRAVFWGVVASAVYDGAKIAGSALYDYYQKSGHTWQDDPLSRGRALL